MAQDTEELTKEERARFYAMKAYYGRLTADQPSASPKLLQYAGMPGRGMIEGAGTALKALGHIPIPGVSDALTGAGTAMQQFGAPTDVDPDVRDSEVGKGLQFAGGAVPIVGAGLVGGPAASIGVMGAQGFEGSYARAKGKGATEGHAIAAGLLGGTASAALGAIPVAKLAGVLEKADGFLGGKLADLVMTSASGGGAMIGMNYASDAIAHSIGNDEEAASVLKAIKETGVAPFLVTAGLHGVGQYVKGKAAERVASKAPASPQEAPAAEPTQTPTATPAATAEPAATPDAASGAVPPGGVAAPVSDTPDVPAEMPKGQQIGTDLTGEPVYSKVERGDAERPGAGIEQPKVSTPGLFDEEGGLFEQQAREGTEAEAMPAKGGTAEEEGFPWEREQTFEEKLQDPVLRQEIRRMADTEAGWDQEGGYMIRTPDADLGGRMEATGRTTWVPKYGETDWFDRVPRTEAGKRPSAAEIKTAVDRALAGQKLGAMQRRVVEHMLEFAPLPNLGRRFAREGPVPGAPSIVVKPSDLNPVTDSLGRKIINIGYGMRGTLEDNTGTAAVQRRKGVVDSIIDAGRTLVPGYTLRLGGLPDGALGVFNPETRTARIARWGDMTTAIHETFHAVEDRVLGTEESPFRTMQGGAERMAEAEKLGRMANPGMTDPPTNGFASEGIAEFGRLWVAQHEDLMHVAPKMTEWFDNVFLKEHPDFAKKLDAARTAADRWRMQGDLKRLEGAQAAPRTIGDRFKGVRDYLRIKNLAMEWTSSLDAATRAEDAKAALGKPTKFENRIDTIARNLAGAADARAQHFVLHETTDLWGNTTGESLKAALHGMKGEEQAFRAYLVARRTEWLLTERKAMDSKFIGPPAEGLKQGETMAPHESGPSLIDAQSTIAKLEAKFPKIGEATDRALAWRDRVNDYVAQCDPLFQKVIGGLRQEGEFYLHLAASFEDQPIKMRGTGSKRAALSGKLAEGLSEGGNTRPIKNVVEVMQRDARTLMARGHERLMLNAMVEHGDEAGLGALHENVTKTLTGSGEGFPIGSEVGQDEVASAALQSFFSKPTIDADSRAVFKYARLVPAEDGTQHVRIEAHAFHPDLYEAMVALNPVDVKTGIPALGILSRLARRGVVAGSVVYAPAFVFYKNLCWDPQSAILNTRHALGLRDLLLDLPGVYARTAVHEITGGKVEYPWKTWYEKLGIATSERYESERQVTSRTRRLLEKPTQRFATYLKREDGLYDILSRIMGTTESAPRVWELKRAAKAVGWDPSQTMTRAQAMYMMDAAKRITGNRTEGGRTATAINQYVGFFRSSFVNPRDSVRAFRANKLSFAIKAGSLTALNALAWYAFRKDKGVQSQDADERVRYTSFPVDIGDRHEAVRIPIVPEFAAVAKPVEFALEAMESDNPVHLHDVMGALWGVLAPPFIPNVASELILQETNRQRIGSQGEIVSDKQTMPNASDEIGPSTGKLAVVLGKITGGSPRRIQHALQGMGGELGGDFANGLGLLNDPAREKDASEKFITGMWLRPGGSVSRRSRWVSELADLNHQADLALNDPKSQTDPSEGMLKRMALGDAWKAVSSAMSIADTFTLKAADRQQLYQWANDHAREVVTDIEKGSVNPGASRGASLQMESRLQMLERERGDTIRKLR